MSTETVVSVDYGDVACVPADFSVSGMPVPKRFGNEEVIVFDLSSEWGWWNVEDGFSPCEVMKVPGNFVTGDFPCRVFSIGIEWMLHVSPSIVKSFDRVIVLFLSHSND